MENVSIDNGQSFDFGKTASEYAKYRDIYPKELYDRLSELGIGKANSVWLDLGTGTGAIPRGLADHGANIIGEMCIRDSPCKLYYLKRIYVRRRHRSRARDRNVPLNGRYRRREHTGSRSRDSRGDYRYSRSRSQLSDLQETA